MAEGGGASASHEAGSAGNPTPYLGCPHYRRKCMLLAPCCGEWVGCRFCHDEKHVDNQRDLKLAHAIDRKVRS